MPSWRSLSQNEVVGLNCGAPQSRPAIKGDSRRIIPPERLERHTEFSLNAADKLSRERLPSSYPCHLEEGRILPSSSALNPAFFNYPHIRTVKAKARTQGGKHVWHSLIREKILS